jgi:hypothetical protein
MLDGILSGRTRVLDLAYAINDKLVPWPGDYRWFEANVNSSVEKDGYSTRSFWMLEHYGTPRCTDQTRRRLGRPGSRVRAAAVKQRR